MGTHNVQGDKTKKNLSNVRWHNNRSFFNFYTPLIWSISNSHPAGCPLSHASSTTNESTILNTVSDPAKKATYTAWFDMHESADTQEQFVLVTVSDRGESVPYVHHNEH